MTRFFVDSRRPDLLMVRMPTDQGHLMVHIDRRAAGSAYGCGNEFHPLLDKVRGQVAALTRTALQKAGRERSTTVLLQESDLRRALREASGSTERPG
jgi:hypothetical protein